MSNRRYPDEFKVEAVKQVTERGRRVKEVAEHLGVSQHSLYAWIRRHQQPDEEKQKQQAKAEEIRRLKAQLREVTDERDILKKAAAYFAKQSG